MSWKSELAGLTGTLSHSNFPQQLVFHSKCKMEGAGPARRRSLRLLPAGRDLPPASCPASPALCLAPALLRTWSPVKFRAAPRDKCREVRSNACPRNHGNGDQWESRVSCGGGAGPKGAGRAGRGAGRGGGAEARGEGNGAGPGTHRPTPGGSKVPRMPTRRYPHRAVLATS